MEQTVHNKKFQKSLHGYQCVGPCYKKNTKIFHPIHLNVIERNDNDFCPTNEWIHKDSFGNLKRYHTDQCDINVNKNKNIDILHPYTNFDELAFLDTFYDINNFSEMLDWMDNNKTLSIHTRQRIFDLSIQAFSSSFDIFDYNNTKIVDFLIELIKNKYLDVFSVEFFKYISIEELKNNDQESNKSVIFKYDKNYDIKNETSDTIIIKQNFIIKHIITIQNMTNFVDTYFRKKKYEEIKNNIEYPSKNIIDKFILFIIGNIKKI